MLVRKMGSLERDGSRLGSTCHIASAVLSVFRIREERPTLFALKCTRIAQAYEYWEERQVLKSPQTCGFRLARITGSRSEVGRYLEQDSIWVASSLKPLSVIRKRFLPDTTLISFFVDISRRKSNDEPSRTSSPRHPRSRNES